MTSGNSIRTLFPSHYRGQVKSWQSYRPIPRISPEVISHVLTFILLLLASWCLLQAFCLQPPECFYLDNIFTQQALSTIHHICYSHHFFLPLSFSEMMPPSSIDKQQVHKSSPSWKMSYGMPCFHFFLWITRSQLVPINMSVSCSALKSKTFP